MKSNIFITGFSGSGKTTVGRIVAQQLGWRFVDIDEVISGGEGTSIEAIFSTLGERHFRRLERDRLSSAAQGTEQVISTGGGVPVDLRNRRVMESNGLVACLEARPETIRQRLLKQSSEEEDPAARPMLADADPAKRIRTLKAERQPSYSLAHWTVHTDSLTPSEAADEVVRGWRVLAGSGGAVSGREDSDLAALVKTSSGDYPVWVGWNILDSLGERVKERLSPGTAYIVSDEGAFRQARRAQAALESSGIPAHMLLLDPGEQSKTLESAQHVYGWLAGRKAERSDLVLAVGGGMVGDLAGFAAATYVRGMPFAQVPTSMLAMMDASVGGKVAVDLPQGKNLVGAFYQPKFVLADVTALKTLPRRELVSGWAEAVKHGLILDSDLFATFEGQRETILSLEQRAATDVIRRSVAIKANVVSQDERETLGIRILLNYGHTIGHAIEAVTGYAHYLHGEAVSVGMMGAAHIGTAMGMMSKDDMERQKAVLEGIGLPLRCPGVDPEALSQAMLSDKKVAGGALRWVLLDEIGKATVRSDVPLGLVQETLTRLSQ